MFKASGNSPISGPSRARTSQRISWKIILSTHYYKNAHTSTASPGKEWPLDSKKHRATALGGCPRSHLQFSHGWNILDLCRLSLRCVYMRQDLECSGLCARTESVS